MLGISIANYYRIEAEGRVPDHGTALKLVDMGVCDHADFHTAAGPDCQACSLPDGHEQVTRCTRVDCQRRGAIEAQDPKAA